MGRRFPPPWIVDVQPECFIVRDQAGSAVAYVYFNEHIQACGNPLRRDEARRIAANIAKLPELLGATRAPSGSP